MYRLTFKRQAVKALVKLPGRESRRIREQLDKMAEDPSRPDIDVKALSGRSGYRLRIGEFRAIIERDNEKRLMTVLRIAPRGQIYKR